MLADARPPGGSEVSRDESLDLFTHVPGGASAGAADGIVGREAELRRLSRLTRPARATLVVVYGRRRVGKTHLLRHAWRGRDSFYHLTAETTPAAARRALVADLARWTGRGSGPVESGDWSSIFRWLGQVASERPLGRRPLIVILDEFQRLAGGDGEGITAALAAAWERELRSRPILLVLCGSDVAAMQRLVSRRSPFHERVDDVLRIDPLDYFDAATLVPWRGLRERALAYGIVGGTPRFLDAVGRVRAGAAADGPRSEAAGEHNAASDDESPAAPSAVVELSRAIRGAVLSPRGPVHIQLDDLLRRQPGIRDPRDYNAVLAALAQGRTETDEIAAAAGRAGRPHVVRRALETLDELGLVQRERDFAAGRRAAWKNRIGDGAVRFWYAFVHPNRSALERGRAAHVWASRVEPRLDGYMGEAFEAMAEQAYRRYHHRWSLPAAAEWSRWRGRVRDSAGPDRPIDIGVVARLEDGRLLTGRAFWRSQPVGVDEHRRLAADLAALADTGPDWAAEALDDGSGGHIYFSAAGFTDELRAAADGAARLHLVDLEGMYPADSTARTP